MVPPRQFWGAERGRWECGKIFCSGWLPKIGAGGCLLFLALFCALPVHAAPPVLVILADHLMLADVTRPDLPQFARLRREGQLALMSPGLARKPDPVANVYASMGAGDSIGVGDKSQGRMAGALRRAGARTALIGNAEGDDTGPYRPALLFLPSPDVANDDEAIADPLACGGRREDPARLWAATQRALQTSNLVVVDFGDFARIERENARGLLLPFAYRRHREWALRALDDYLGRALRQCDGPLFIAVPTPPPVQADGSWNSLTPFLARIKGDDAHSLSSDTTQTPGLIAARDLAPTLLAALHVSAPLQMTGAAVRPVSVSGRALARLDRLVRLNQDAQNAIFWAVGVGATVIVFGGLGLYLRGRMTGRLRVAARYGLRLLSAWPLALLLAPPVGSSAVNPYLAVIAALVCLLALLPSPTLIFGVTALVLVLDGLTGAHLAANSALSEYALSGIRFYGIGNEYMGVLIGGALLACLVRFGSRPAWGESSLGVGWGLWFAVVTFVLSFPAFGAKAGGAITATATFVVAWRLLTNRRVRWTHLVGSIALGFALVLLWAVLSHLLHLRRTHLETAADALGQGRFGYIAGVSLRKIGLAVRVALHPGTLLGLLALAGLALVIRRWLWGQVLSYLRERPREAALLKAGLWGCLVALLFNDSGIVAAILILQCLALLLLHGLYGKNRHPFGTQFRGNARG